MYVSLVTLARPPASRSFLFTCLTLSLEPTPMHFLSCQLLTSLSGPILSVFFALIVHSELKSVHPGFPVAFIF